MNTPLNPSATVLAVTGMTCGHCARTVERAAAAVPGVERAQVDLRNATLTVAGTADPALVADAVRDAGYDVEEAGA